MEDRYWGMRRRKSGHAWRRLRWWTGPCFDLTPMEVFYSTSNSVFVYWFCDKNDICSRDGLQLLGALFIPFEIIFIAVNSPKQPTQLYQVQSGVGFAFQPRTLPWWLLWIWMTWRCFTAASKLNSRERFHSLKGSCLAVIFCEGSGTFHITKLIVISRIEPWHRNLNYIPPIHLIYGRVKTQHRKERTSTIIRLLNNTRQQ